MSVDGTDHIISRVKFVQCNTMLFFPLHNAGIITLISLCNSGKKVLIAMSIDTGRHDT